MLCNYLMVGLMMTLAAERHGWIGKRLAVAMVAVHMVAAFFTLTPGLGGFVLAGAAWIAHLLWQKRPWAARLAAFGGIFLASASVLVSAVTLRQVPTSPYRFELWGTTIDPTQRLLTWQGSFGTFAAHPLVGKGLGEPAAAVEFLTPSGVLQMLTDAHNIFLNIAAQTGANGLAAVLLLCVATILAGRRAMADNLIAGDRSLRADRSSASNRPLAAALLIAFVSGFIIAGLTGSFEDARHLWLVIGLIFALVSAQQAGAQRSVRSA